MSRLRGAGLIAISLAVAPLLSATAAAQNIAALRQQVAQNKRDRDRLNKEIPAAQKKIDAASADTEKLRADVDTQKKEVDGLREQSKAANDKVNAAKTKLDGISEQLESGQPTDSPLALAKGVFQKTKAAYVAERDRVYASAEYKQAYDLASASGDRVKMADVSSQFLEADAAATEALRVAKEAHAAYAAIRDKLVHNDAGWQAASEELKSARADLTTAKKAEADGLKKLGDAKRKQGEQMVGVNRARTMIERNKAAILQLDQANQQLDQRIQQLQRSYPYVH